MICHAWRSGSPRKKAARNTSVGICLRRVSRCDRARRQSQVRRRPKSSRENHSRAIGPSLTPHAVRCHASAATTTTPLSSSSPPPGPGRAAAPPPHHPRCCSSYSLNGGTKAASQHLSISGVSQGPTHERRQKCIPRRTRSDHRPR
jgi:hypothetical protein